MEQLIDLKAILYSKRANVFYLEKCRVVQKRRARSLLNRSERPKFLLEYPNRQYHSNLTGYRNFYYASCHVNASKRRCIGEILRQGRHAFVFV
jgi:hypothetical protein